MPAEIIENQEIVQTSVTPTQGDLVDKVLEGNETAKIELEGGFKEVQEDNPNIPDKFKGKALEDVIKAYGELEKLAGKQAQEVGEVRKLADELLKRDLQKFQAEPEGELNDVDFFADPIKAMERAVAKHPKIIAAEEAASRFKQLETANRLARNHPDFQEVTASEEFAKWVAAKPLRKELYLKADREFDFDAADELISTYKELANARKESVKFQTQGVQEEARQALSNSKVGNTTGTGEVSNKIFRRADLIALNARDPDRYQQLLPEIYRAYQDGRVRD